MDEINVLVSGLDQRCYKDFFLSGCAEEVHFPLFAVEYALLPAGITSPMIAIAVKY